MADAEALARARAALRALDIAVLGDANDAELDDIARAVLGASARPPASPPNVARPTMRAAWPKS